MLRVALFILMPWLAAAASSPPLLSYNTLPLGTAEAPLALRTFVPDPGIDDTVFAHHGRGKNALKYDIDAGKDTANVVAALGEARSSDTDANVALRFQER